jgi:hypothetical protein
MYEISGRDGVHPPHRNVTLDFVLKMGPLGISTSIREVMDTAKRDSRLCYTYS